MNRKYKFLAILLAGIVCFSINNLTSYASQTADPADTTEEEGAAPEDPTQLPIESNDISGWPQGPAVSAESAIVMDAETGTVLYSKNIDARQYPASITKIMTVLVALENSSMDETVVFSRNAVFSIERNSSHIARTDGEELTMEQCIYAIMLESANECANAVAEHIAGSVEAFADMMNAKAAELGCINTHFVNPHGLHDENHYTSAHDMALITQAALQIDAFREIAGTVRYAIPPTNKNDEELMMYNHHSMMSAHKTSRYLDESVFAGKTGYTTDALNTLVTCASRNDMDLICVLLRSPSGTPYPDTSSLLDYVTENFTRETLSEIYSEYPEDIRNNISGSLKGLIPSGIYKSENCASCVVRPINVPFDALTPEVSVQATGDSAASAVITYYYETVPVGNISFHLDLTETVPSSLNTTPSKPDAAQPSDADSSPGKDSSKSIVKYLIIAVITIIILLLATVILLLVRAHQENIRRKHRRERRRRRAAARARQATSNDNFDFDEFSRLEELNDFNFRQNE